MKYTVRELIRALERTEYQDDEVHISVDEGETTFPLDLLGRTPGKFVLMYVPGLENFNAQSPGNPPEEPSHTASKKPSYRITKFDPSLRDQLGVYSRVDWVSPSDVGNCYGGKRLTIDDYLQIESAYVAAVIDLWREANSPPFYLAEIEDYRHAPPSLPAPLRVLEESILVEKNVRYEDPQTLAILVRLALRELFWYRIESPAGFFVHFTGDMYMYCGGVVLRQEIHQQIENRGLFVETFESPLSEDS